MFASLLEPHFYAIILYQMCRVPFFSQTGVSGFILISKFTH